MRLEVQGDRSTDHLTVDVGTIGAGTAFVITVIGDREDVPSNARSKIPRRTDAVCFLLDVSTCSGRADALVVLHDVVCTKGPDAGVIGRAQGQVSRVARTGSCNISVHFGVVHANGEGVKANVHANAPVAGITCRS